MTRWPRKEQPSVESGPISNLLFRNGQLQPSWRFQYQGGKKNYYRFCLWNGCPALLKWTFDWSENQIVARICKRILKIGILTVAKKSLRLKRLPSDSGGIKFCKLEHLLFEGGIWSEAVVNSVWGGAVSDWIYTHLTPALLFAFLIKDVIRYHFANLSHLCPFLLF